MELVNIKLPERKLIGISTRTNNKELFEAGDHNKIALVCAKYFGDALHEKIPNRVNAYTTYGAYHDYESDFNGNFTYFFGEEVSSFDNLPEEMETLTIPAQNYAKFTEGPGPLPHVCIELWQEIWTTKKEEMGGERAYKVDFELYDDRSIDRGEAIIDIYISIK